MNRREPAPRREDLIERLRSRHAKLENRLDRLATDRRKENGALDPDFAEQAVERENDEVLDRLDEAEREELEAVRAALARIEDGSFGVCSDCGTEIDAKRLDVQPSAERCVPCEERRESASARA